MSTDGHRVIDAAWNELCAINAETGHADVLTGRPRLDAK